LGLAAGGAAYLKLWLPATHLAVPCPFYKLTGCYCPGCGITRAALSLLSGDVEQAFRYNALIFALAPLYLVYAIAKRRRMPRTGNVMMAVMMTATLLFGLLRNLPDFQWLAPTAIR
jgi:hypothetical protein